MKKLGFLALVRRVRAAGFIVAVAVAGNLLAGDAASKQKLDKVSSNGALEAYDVAAAPACV